MAETIRPEALQLDTALLFSAVREAATAEERQRLAREMHDGVAQDLASLGYLIDDLAAGAETPEQATRLAELREELTSVVTELRRSVFSLRNEAAPRALARRQPSTVLAAHLEARTGIAVQVIRRRGPRPAPARGGGRAPPHRAGGDEQRRQARERDPDPRHAARCAPARRITVTDDGVGLRPGRDDSHGLRIMRERAKRIGAVLDLADTGRGTRLGSRSADRTTGRTTTAPLEGSTTR